MALNSLYPGFIKLAYEVSGHRHIKTIPVKPFLSLGVDWYLEQKQGGAGVFWETGVDAFVLAWKALLNSTNADILYADLWTMASVDSDPLWVANYQVNAAGTNATTVLQYGQAVITCRTAEGGLYRDYTMEPAAGLNTRTSRNDMTGVYLAYAQYLESGASVVVGRDTSFITTAIWLTTKNNDKLRRKFLLDV